MSEAMRRDLHYDGPDVQKPASGEAPAPSVKRRLWHRAKNLTPNQLLFGKYKLTKREKLVMIAVGAVLSFIATPVGNAIYYLAFQVRYQTENAGQPPFTLWYLKDTWDRLPVHVQNLLHQHWFHGQGSPLWWVTARHDARQVLIGLIVMLLITSITIGLSKKERKRVKPAWIALSPITVLMAAVPGATAGILLFVMTPLGGWVKSWGAHTGIAPIDVWVGKGSWELTIIGLLAGYFFAKKVFRPVASTIQLTSIENKLAEGQEPKFWWKFVYTPNYVKRFEYLKASGHECQSHGKVLGMVMAFGTPILLFLLGYGVWLTYFSGILPR